MVHLVPAVEHLRGEGKERAEQPAVHRGGKDVQRGGPVAGTAVASVREAPPEERRGDEVGQMLGKVQRLVPQRAFVKARHVPHPQRRGMQHEDHRRRRERAPREARPAPVDAGAELAAHPVRQRPQEHHHRCTHRDERRRDDHEQLVLHHVCREPGVAPGGHRRRQRHRQRAPSNGKRRHLVWSHAAAVSRLAPQAPHAGGIRGGIEGQATGKHRASTAEWHQPRWPARKAPTTSSRAPP